MVEALPMAAPRTKMIMARWGLTAAGVVALVLGVLSVAWWPLLMPLGGALIAVGGALGLLPDETQGRLARMFAVVQLAVGVVLAITAVLLLLYVD